LASLFYSAWKVAKYPQFAFLLPVFIFEVFNRVFTGSIEDRNLWFWFGMVVALSRMVHHSELCAGWTSRIVPMGASERDILHTRPSVGGIRPTLTREFPCRHRPMIIALLILAIVTALIVPSSCARPEGTSSSPEMITNSYVSPAGSDQNSGSASSPWRTLQHASDLAQPGSTVHVAPGIYNVSSCSYPASVCASVTTSASGAASARIRFISDIKWGAKIVSSNSTYAAWQVDGSYVDIIGFDISGPAGSGPAVGLKLNGSHQRAISNHAHDLVAPCDGIGGAGIDSINYTASDNDVIGNVVHDIYPPSGCTSDHGPGIYISNLRARVWNNIVYRTREGIHLWHAAASVTVSGNTAFNNRLAGILVGCGDTGCVISDNNIVTDNIVYGNPTYGIHEFGIIGTNNQFLNNLVYLNGTNWSLLNGNTHSGDVTADPQFVNYKNDGTGDYHLQATSPAIDRGTSIGAPANDIDGGSRPVGSNWDIGAYEWGATAAVWPWLLAGRHPNQLCLGVSLRTSHKSEVYIPMAVIADPPFAVSADAPTHLPAYTPAI
jgi:parallel beta-helix repeat protein